MSRPYRHIHPGGTNFEITTRTLQSRFLLPAGAHFRSISIGIMARAKAETARKEGSRARTGRDEDPPPAEE